MSTHNIGFYDRFDKNYLSIIIKYAPYSAASPLLTETEVCSFSGITFLDTLGS